MRSIFATSVKLAVRSSLLHTELLMEVPHYTIIHTPPVYPTVIILSHCITSFDTIWRAVTLVPVEICLVADIANFLVNDQLDAQFFSMFFFLLALQPPLGVVFYSPLVGFSLLACEVS